MFSRYNDILFKVKHQLLILVLDHTFPGASCPEILLDERAGISH